MKYIFIFIYVGMCSLAQASSTINNYNIHDSDNIFKKYDLAKKILLEWNNHISNHEPDKLINLYADQLQAYTKTQSAQECIDNKTKWLAAHPTYKQKLKNIEIYYYDHDSTVSLLICEFIKICIDNGKTTEVNSFLHIAKTGNGWKIIKETDQPTEILIAKKLPISSLSPGKYNFYLGYWEDTRSIPEFAHDQVPYNFSMNITVGKKIKGEFSFYSGTARSITSYLILDGNITDGILDIAVVYNGYGEYTVEEYLEEYENSVSKAEHWYFKIIDGKELMCINKEGMPYGKRMYINFEF